MKPSLLNRVLTPTIFLLGGIGAVTWFACSVGMLLLPSESGTVLVEKGSYYMLGVGIGMLDLAFIVIWEQWLVKPVTKSITKIFSWLAIGSVVLLLALPQIIYFVADEHLTSKDYAVCEEASHEWLFVRNIMYVKPPVVCSESLRH